MGISLRSQKKISLGSNLSFSGDLSNEIQRRINLASSAFGRLSKRVFGNQNLTIHTKIVVCNAVVISTLHVSVVHASGSGQLQANPHVAGPWLSPGKPTRRAVTTMVSNDLVVGEVHMLGPSCQRYNWHTGRCGSIAFGSSHRRGKTLISIPRCLAEVSTRGRDFRR